MIVYAATMVNVAARLVALSTPLIIRKYVNVNLYFIVVFSEYVRFIRTARVFRVKTVLFAASAFAKLMNDRLMN